MDILVFNRVPKTGSVQLTELMKRLAKVHNYEVSVDQQKGGIQVILDEAGEEEWADNIANLQEPISFVSHVNFINFTKYEQPRPIYINMVRDPIERVISWFYYVRSPWVFVPQRKNRNKEMPHPTWVNLDYDQCVKEQRKVCSYIEGSGLEKVGDHRRQTLFFCGHNGKKCMPFNAKMPLQIAKRNVEREYAVVGTWEDTNITLAVLEKYIPKYFQGATQLYYMGLSDEIRNSNPMKPHISEEIKDIVRKNFTREIEFYQFCRQRLHKQYLAIKLDEIMSFDKSLLETLRASQLNNTRNAEFDAVFFNRAAKVGSESLMELFAHLAKFNDLNVRQNIARNITQRVRTPKQQKDIANTVIELGTGSVYIEHVNFINFTKFDMPKPIFINLVRDPVERVISWFFYIRGAHKNALEFKKFPNQKIKSESWFKKDYNTCVRSGDPECQYAPYAVIDTAGDYRRQSLFFCGHMADCLPFNSPRAVQMAKRNVEKEYAVVGSWEDTNITLTVLEHYIPRYFQGARFLYDLHKDDITNRNKNKRKPKIFDDVKELVKKNFTHEYDFYRFCKQRLYKQYIAIKLLNK